MNDLPVSEPNYQPPLNQLLNLGRPKDHSVALNYASFGIVSEHIPELIRMATDNELHTASGKSALVWAPVHAWRALEELKAEQAIGPLLGLLHRIDDYDDDWVSSDVPCALGAMGRAALEPVTVYLADTAHKEWARVASAKAMAEIGERHADLRAECVARLTAQLAKFRDQSELLNAFLISPLLDLKAQEALPVMQMAFVAGLVDESVVGDYEDVEIELGLKKRRQHPRKPDEFMELGAELRALMAGHQTLDATMDDEIDPVLPQPHPKLGKIGRNELCPCGSGKKYKKCCG